MHSKILQRNTEYQDKVEQLLARLAPLDEALLNRPAANGGWSAIQTVHHLILSEELSLGYVRKKLSFPAQLETVGLKTRLRAASLWFYLNLPVRFKAPAMVSDAHLPNFATLADTRERWQKIRIAWTDFLQQLPPDLEKKAVYRHPFSGRMSWLGMLGFFNDHLERHQKQILRTLAEGRQATA